MNSTNVASALLDIFNVFDAKDLPTIFKGIVPDNGTEFAKLPQIEKTTGINMYFARPYRSSDKPHVERQNRIIRYHVPNGCDISEYDEKDIN